jgi:hypothetical protein
MGTESGPMALEYRGNWKRGGKQGRFEDGPRELDECLTTTLHQILMHKRAIVVD